LVGGYEMGNHDGDGRMRKNRIVEKIYLDIDSGISILAKKRGTKRRNGKFKSIK
jgi:hypothetical protein